MSETAAGPAMPGGMPCNNVQRQRSRRRVPRRNLGKHTNDRKQAAIRRHLNHGRIPGRCKRETGSRQQGEVKRSAREHQHKAYGEGIPLTVAHKREWPYHPGRTDVVNPVLVNSYHSTTEDLLPAGPIWQALLGLTYTRKIDVNIELHSASLLVTVITSMFSRHAKH